jgi:hypothetical protein
MGDFGVWRIRMKYGDRDYTEEAWDRNEVGLWYGGWAAEELEAGISNDPTRLEAFLSSCPSQRALQWLVPKSFVQTVLRFREISTADWVLVYLRGKREIGLARIASNIQSESDHPLNKGGEIFKYRKIRDKKTFKIFRLPDAYQLLASQGRSNVYKLASMRLPVKLLVESKTEHEVVNTLKNKPFDELLEFLGASAWESLCFAYLILEEEFIPTGLSIGRTLPVADIVGRRKSDGAQIFCQCKKDNKPQPIEPDFLAACENLETTGVAYYFAYGGCSGKTPPRVKIVGREEVLSWVSTKRGIRFRELLLQ